ncbi:hypothetical protein H6G96_37285 [Nostoc sp. FACHB-892]|uniref:hypothetical protein n=1 Tax=unclassified Nostoc TaxID=2593658 RepID=UPI00168377F2|nr:MULTISPECIES: hypothetical protein [unclassified Nostoc]MBD2246290.1 hypothetical protein [Nostoc sp. FACHB-888]MBD2731780.1 hypothetical protein [Nostoc sp. FACHB-892]
MASLSNPTLQIDLLTGSDPNVTATVNVTLTPFENFVVSQGLVNLQLAVKLVGEDGNFFNGGNDDLYFFPTKNFTNAGINTFQALVSLGTLDEDIGNDEIFANFTLQSTEQAFPVNTSINSNVIVI